MVLIRFIAMLKIIFLRIKFHVHIVLHVVFVVNATAACLLLMMVMKMVVVFTIPSLGLFLINGIVRLSKNKTTTTRDIFVGILIFFVHF
jgi:hypothetical protein